MNIKNIKLSIIIAAAILLIAAIPTFLLLPSFNLSAPSAELEAGEEFDAKSYIEKVRNIDLEKIKITEKIDSKIPGEYQVTYSYKKIKKVLTLKVVDTIAPKLTPKKNLSIYAGKAIKAEMLVSVQDATECKLELDSKGKNLSEIGQYTVAVSATDLGGNVSICDVKIAIKDPDIKPPIISGVQNISIKIGSKFDSKKGVSITDDHDKNPELTIDDRDLNTKKAGKYTVIYTAKDQSGNQTTIKRIITVYEPAPPTSTKNFLDQRGVANQPYLVAVNRAMCTVTVYKKDASGNYTIPVKAMVCSVGRSGHSTPVGRYNTTDRYTWRLMVDGSYGRYAIRVNKGIMFHSVCYYSKDESDLEYLEYNKLGSPASLGCIRLCLKDIKWIYDNCPKGFPAVIYDDPSSPGPLGKPSSIKIDINDIQKRGYDPTDWSPNSPWNK